MSDTQVASTETTSVSVSTKLPTYYSYRLTIGHEFKDEVAAICRKYSDDWCFVMHNPDADDHNPHYHFVFMDLHQKGRDHKKHVDNLQKAFKDRFKGKGNEFHAGKWRDNDVEQALQYFSHDPVSYVHYPDSWAPRIKDAPAWVPKDGSSGSTHRGPREKLGDPVLSYSNLVKQAVKYRATHCMDTSSLTNVLSRMVNQDSWIPSRDLLNNGVPRELHELFAARLHKRKWDPDWMYPHDRSEDKQKWLDRPDTRSRIYPDPVPGGDNRITKEYYDKK